MRVFEQACVCGCKMPLHYALQGAAAGVVSVFSGVRVGAAAECHCRVLLQGAAVRVACAFLERACLSAAGCALWSWIGCCCRVRLQVLLWPAGAVGALLQGAAVRVACALWSCPACVQGFRVLLVACALGRLAGAVRSRCRVRLQDAAAGCRCSVLPSECSDVRCALAWVLAPFKGVAAVELGCWCGCRGGDISGSVRLWDLMEITFTPCKEWKVFGCCPKIVLLFGVYAGVINYS